MCTLVQVRVSEMGGTLTIRDIRCSMIAITCGTDGQTWDTLWHNWILRNILRAWLFDTDCWDAWTQRMAARARGGCLRSCGSHALLHVGC